MWTATIYVTICAGWLCKAIHGEEVEIPLTAAQQTEAACMTYAREVDALAARNNPEFRSYARRISCARST